MPHMTCPRSLPNGMCVHAPGDGISDLLVQTQLPWRDCPPLSATPSEMSKRRTDRT